MLAVLSLALCQPAGAGPARESRVPRFAIGTAQIELLEAGLARYEANRERGGWPTVPAGPTIGPGAVDSRVAVLAARLGATGDLSANALPRSGLEYDPVLVAAVRRFQHRHGLEPDGLVGRRTLAALNVRVDTRVKQIGINLERARTLSETADFAVVVNIPTFHATLIRDGIAVWATRVIVGDIETPTPELAAMITEIVLNPTWAVPAKIAAEEILPSVLRDPGFLARGGYTLYAADGSIANPADVAWTAMSPRNFPYRIVQRPGPANQLGQVKFVIPNANSVFLHDTPKKALFERAVRAFSHGCIRIQDPLVLAEAILGRGGWTRAAIDEQLATGKTRSLLLPSPVPIQVLYQTVLAETDGTLFFADDIYGLDAMRFDQSRATGAQTTGCAPL